MQLIDWHLIKKANVLSVFFPFSVTHGCYSCGWLLRHPIIIDSKNLAPRRSKNWERMLLCAKGLRKRTDIFKIKIGICNPVQVSLNGSPQVMWQRETSTQGEMFDSWLVPLCTFLKTDDIYVYITATA